MDYISVAIGLYQIYTYIKIKDVHIHIDRCKVVLLLISPCRNEFLMTVLSIYLSGTLRSLSYFRIKTNNASRENGNSLLEFLHTEIARAWV